MNRRDRRPVVLAEAVAILGRTPSLLNAWLLGLPAAWLDAHEGGETWSPVEVVGHLVHGEREDWMPRLRRLLEHGPALPFDPFDRFAQLRERGRPVADLLAEFERRRAANLGDLVAMGLGESDLERTGMHPDLGPVTLRQLLACWVAHDLDHVMQIARVLGTQYADEVGPWRAYLRVISGRQG